MSSENTNSSASIFNQKPEIPPVPPSNENVKTPVRPDSGGSGMRECEEVDVINLHHIDQIYKTKKSEFVLFKDFNLDIKDFTNNGQFVAILGQSGCGKSTILRYISGLQKPTSGKVLIYGKEKTEKDTIPMVFQQYSSLPWKTVLDNIALPLEMRGVSKEERYARAHQMIKTVGLEGHENKWAKYPLLSGGQLQRVAIARNLIASPQILLMDEPFGALDIATRANMQQTLLDIFNSATLDPTVVFVTHDINEAVLLSNRIYILTANPGKVHSIIDIDLPDKRDVSLKKSERLSEYVNYIDHIMNTINRAE